MPTPIWDRWWFRAFVAMAIFFIYQLMTTITKLQSLEEGKTSLSIEISRLEQEKENLRMDIFAKERDIVRYQRRIDKLDLQLKDKLSLLPAQRNDAVIYFVTPTGFRPAQKADLTRLSYTLSHVPNLHWIIVEDSDSPSASVNRLLKRSKVAFTHLNAKTPETEKMNYSQPNWYLPRGVIQRNTALQWIRTQLRSSKKAVVYFGDDDNTYDLRLFGEMRRVEKVAIWPVGIVGGQFVEGPVVQNGKVVRFEASWKPERPFPVDMAAFAVNSSLLISHPDAAFKFDVPRGYQESQFLTSLGVSMEELEPKAVNCTKVYVWHTRTEKTKLAKTDVLRLSATEKNFSPLESEALGVD